MDTGSQFMNRILEQFGIPFPFNMLELDTDLSFSKGAMMIDVKMVYS